MLFDQMDRSYCKNRQCGDFRKPTTHVGVLFRRDDGSAVPVWYCDACAKRFSEGWSRRGWRWELSRVGDFSDSESEAWDE